MRSRTARAWPALVGGVRTQASVEVRSRSVPPRDRAAAIWGRRGVLSARPDRFGTLTGALAARSAGHVSETTVSDRRITRWRRDQLPPACLDMTVPWRQGPRRVPGGSRVVCEDSAEVRADWQGRRLWPSYGFPVESDRSCGSCGTPLPTDARYCPHCAHPTAGDQSSRQS